MAAGNEKEETSGHWPTVRDSWVDDAGTPSSTIPLAPHDVAIETPRPSVAPAPEPVLSGKSMPPPLPHSDPTLPESESPRAEMMFERLAENDYEGALLVAQSILSRVPHNQDALECAEMAARELWKLHERRLGSLDRVPIAHALPDALPPTLNLRAGFLLARVDGVATIREIVDRAGLPLIDALRGLAELYLVGAIGFEPRAT